MVLLPLGWDSMVEIALGPIDFWLAAIAHVATHFKSIFRRAEA